MTIGKRIADRRKAQKITQAALADAVRVSTAFISQIESGRRNPSYGLMRKLAHELQSPIESFLSEETKPSDSPLDKFIFALAPSLDDDKKRKIIEHIFTITGCKYYKDIPLLTSPVEYAQFINKKYKIKETPIDILQLAKNLGVEIIKANIKDHEGILYKNQESPIIILDSTINHQAREEFTLAVLLGHLIIPWHLKNNFYRDKDRRSLDHEEKFEIEARQFAGELILPGLIVKSDFKNIRPTIEIFEKYANEKYKCSMTALAHRYSNYYGSKAVYITSDKNNFSRIYEKGFPYKLVDEVKKGSFAYSFIEQPPASKETRKGVVEGNIWFKDIPAEIKVDEESMLDPKFGITVTLLQLKRT